MKELKIVTIGGGSSYTPELVEGLIRRKKAGILNVKEFWLVDIEEGKKKLEIIAALAKRMVESSGVDMEIHASLDRREALKGADFVTTQFRVGKLDSRIEDERRAYRFGLIGQETNGVGGFTKTLRTVPVILYICRDMSRRMAGQLRKSLRNGDRSDLTLYEGKGDRRVQPRLHLQDPDQQDPGV